MAIHTSYAVFWIQPFDKLIFQTSCGLLFYMAGGLHALIT